MARVKTDILSFVGPLSVGILFALPAGGQGTSPPPPPKLLYDTAYEIGLDVLKTGCGGTATSRTVPLFPASGIKLDVGDTYEIAPSNVVAQTPLLNWSGVWHWTDKCGKRGRDTCPVDQPRVATSSAIYGSNIKVIARQIGGNARTDQLGLQALTVVVEKPTVLQVIVTVGDLPKPDNPKPRQDAVETTPFCATVAAPWVRIANARIRITRRFQ